MLINTIPPININAKQLLKNFCFALTLVVLSSCDLDESPPFLDQSIYQDPQSAEAARDGVFAALASYDAQERRLFVENGFSGLFVTRRNGNKLTSQWNANLFKLKPNDDTDTQGTWSGLYSFITRANTVIENSMYDINTTDQDQIRINAVVGQAYFARALAYFKLTRLWGDIPLWLNVPDENNVNKAVSTSKEVYAQIIADATLASQLITDENATVGYPKGYAANMLLAKVYMTLATNPSLQEDGKSEMDYWNLAYVEAKKVEGQYALVDDYATLFDGKNENTSESIFELQISKDAANSQMGRNYSPWQYKAGAAFGWFSVAADVYDTHAATYPSDPRLASTYLHEYNRIDNGSPVRVYPTNASRNNFGSAFPYFFKYAEKDTSNSNQFNSQNIIVFRYADLLLMLAEISNELQKPDALDYVTAVLQRSGQVPHAGYLGDQDSFRNAIMQEYRFELLGEGDDAHNNRRRGYAYFLEHTINAHNNNPNFKASVDIQLNDVESEVMFLQIPLNEKNTNNLIN